MMFHWLQFYTHVTGYAVYLPLFPGFCLFVCLFVCLSVCLRKTTIHSRLSCQSIFFPPCLHHGEYRGSHSFGIVVEGEIVGAWEGGEAAVRVDDLVQPGVSL